MPAKSLAFARMKHALLDMLPSIEAGRLALLSDVAVALNIPPRHVAYILSQLSADEAAAVPWHRIVPKSGKFPVVANCTARQIAQLDLLAAEGVLLDRANIIVDLTSRLTVLPDTHKATFWADYG
jgi:methylated-DNA-protein-cysteine methyltransferase related protein